MKTKLQTIKKDVIQYLVFINKKKFQYLIEINRFNLKDLENHFDQQQKVKNVDL